MWHINKLVTRVFTTSDSQNAWANIEGVGWLKVRTGATDGVTNMFLILSSAKANDRRVNVMVEAVNGSDHITRAYLN